MKISVSITTFNRAEWTIRCFENIINHPIVDDICILDDCSTDGSFEILNNAFGGYDHVRVIRQLFNRKMSQNKADAISFAKNDWTAIIDSDNVFHEEYVSALKNVPSNYWTPEIIMLPSFAKTEFDYRQYSGIMIDINNAKEVISSPMGNCLFNTCNFVVNKNFYGSVYINNPDHKASDTIWHNYNHLLAGGKLFVVPGMEYIHTVHPESGFMEDVHYNMKMVEEVRNRIINL